MIALMHTLDRVVVIRARPETVFRYFTDSDRWAAWWGAGSTVDPHPGGRIYIRYPDGTEVAGEVLELASPSLFAFTYGFASGTPIPAGASRVTIRLAAHAEGTRLTLRHEFADAAVRDHHVQGWRYQLSLFANVVADEALARAAEATDAWFAAWADTDEASRARALSAVAGQSVQLHDRFSAIEGLDELVAHIGAAQRFMPGTTLQRQGDVKRCQGMVLANWAAVASDGQPRGAGTNVFIFSSDGKIASVTGFWS
ncbi:MAG TPA: SRPBCC domain-containing protein [Vicinamibacterales bacterium]|jgi:uncharacterized protein YndB with AHSA1/START domain|nr:SRPBCC domain-containing protein [Vicinamibacterales bacterium]